VTNDGRPKRWVVVRPPGAATGLLLARADGEDQAAVIGKQAAGRVGFFLHVEDFDAVYTRMKTAGVQFVTPPRTEPYGRVAVFPDPPATNGIFSVLREGSGGERRATNCCGVGRLQSPPPYCAWRTPRETRSPLAAGGLL
jgi:hypothetical protein